MPLFDGKASTYDDFCSTPMGRFVDRIEREMMAAAARPVIGEKAVDLGCGTGAYSYWLSDLGLSVVGIDISEDMLEVARRKRERGATFMHADLARVPFGDHTFDLAVCNVVLEFVDDPEAVLREGFRVLKPGGRLVAGCISGSGKWGRKYAKRGQEDPTSIYRHARFFTFEDMKKIGPNKPAEVQFGLYAGPDEFQDFDTAARLERQFQGQQHDAGYFVVRWDKCSNA